MRFIISFWKYIYMVSIYIPVHRDMNMIFKNLWNLCHSLFLPLCKVSLWLYSGSEKRFKGLDLIDRVPDELWTEVCDIVQEGGIKTIPMEKKCKKAKWLCGEALQIAVKRREGKSKGEKERYTHLNAEFQIMARKDKKPSSAINAKK